MVIPELFLLGVLKEGFEELAKNSQVIQDIFTWDSPLDISRFQAVLQDSKKLNIILGFPTAVVKDNTIGITLGEQEEDDQFVGEAHQVCQPTGLGSQANNLYNQDISGTMFVGNWRLTIYSSNAELAVKLAYAVKYLLLTHREYLTQAGLLEQHLSMADFEPIPDYLPDIVYVRAVMLKSKTLDTFRDVERITPIDNFNIQEEDVFSLALG
jgi:hypothetical protein